MRFVERLTLNKETIDFLWARRQRVVEAGDKAARESDRKAAQYVEALALSQSSYKKNKAFDEIRMKLRAMAPGHEFCMYCEHNHANVIDHFCPVENDPTLAFSWDNYLWSCSICNTDFKGTRFPLDRNGRRLLLDPTRDEPREHLSFWPRARSWPSREAGSRWPSWRRCSRAKRRWARTRPTATSMRGQCRSFARRFREHHRGGARLPEVYHDPRSLSFEATTKGVLHAKCIIVDDELALVTSANFSEAAHSRNIEAGVLVDNAPFARALRRQFETLASSRLLLRVPGIA